MLIAGYNDKRVVNVVKRGLCHARYTNGSHAVCVVPGTPMVVCLFVGV